jgi:hypothetical protein
MPYWAELMFQMLYNYYCMEIAESNSWIALGFLPVFGSMEVAWRLGKNRCFKPRTKKGRKKTIFTSEHYLESYHNQI